MAQSKILIDSNTYFRLAKSIHPLLDVVFCEQNYCLYVLKELDDEFNRNKRLKTMFAWVNEEEYAANRRKRLTISRKEKSEITITVGYLRQHKIDNKLGISEVDILCLAHGHILGIPIVTDDADMLQVAKDFSIKTMKTLELMCLMLECGYIDIEKVRQIAAYWEYLSDKPGGFRNDYISIFEEKPP